jgi:hypothetical protein
VYLLKSAAIRRRLFLAIGFLITTAAYAQRERQIQAPEEPDSQYSRRFFTQLHGVFGRFRDTDLRRAFDAAQPIQCSELVNDPGIWKTVAFFNEKRELGDWYRSSLEEVKSDLAAFVFKGTCRGDRGSVQLTTKFPVTETTDAFNRGRIPFDEIEVNVNAPVRASFDDQTQAYTFELPYLFLVSQQSNQNVYTLDPPTVVDREKYARDVVNRWECKSVTAEAVTYQFLICRTVTAARDPRVRSNERAAFGATAYFILSDGKEAASTVRFTFNDESNATHTIEDASRANAREPAADPDKTRGAWTRPDPDERIVDIVRDGFRIRFPSSLWSSRIRSSQVLSEQKASSLRSSQPPAGADICIWLPGDEKLADRLVSENPDVLYSAAGHDQEGQSSTSIVFDMKSQSGDHLGSLQCVFPHRPSAASIEFSRWKAIVGDYLVLEVQP